MTNIPLYAVFENAPSDMKLMDFILALYMYCLGLSLFPNKSGLNTQTGMYNSSFEATIAFGHIDMYKAYIPSPNAFLVLSSLLFHCSTLKDPSKNVVYPRN